MDSKFLELYNQELKFIRESGAEFAKEYPKIAGRLGMDGIDCSDPYVERLLEGFAFLSARIHRKLDASFPEFTQHLMELLFPTFLQPVPSMLIAQCQPDYDEGNLNKGFTLPARTSLFSQLAKDEQTSCEYKTAQDVQLWPVELSNAEYVNTHTLTSLSEQSATVPLWLLDKKSEIKSAVRLTFELPPHTKFSDLSLDSLTFYLKGSESFPFYLYESLIKGYAGLMYQSGDSLWRYETEPTSLSPKGFDESDALLPFEQRQFDGFRLLREYFAFPSRFLFVELNKLQPCLQYCTQSSFSVLLLLTHTNSQLENRLTSENLSLYCSPAINLFEKRAERINLSKQYHEFHVVPDRLRPLDFEVCAVKQINAFGSSSDKAQPLLPLYGQQSSRKIKTEGYYSVFRRQRLLSAKGRKFGHRSSYLGSEVYVSIVNPLTPPYSEDLKQLSIQVLCSNRDLPIMMPLGKGGSDFTIESGAPCSAVSCLGEPTKPHRPLNTDDVSWELINLLSLNFLGFSNQEEALVSLTRLLTLMSDQHSKVQTKQIDGVVGFELKPITARLPFDGPICFGRGVEVRLTVDESAFQGGSAFLLGMVLDRFFAQYVSINAFSKLVLLSTQRDEIYTWPIRIGLQSAI
jgi:type VI secretion system protein ImpG